jgi:hypothetical protein
MYHFRLELSSPNWGLILPEKSAMKQEEDHHATGKRRDFGRSALTSL